MVRQAVFGRGKQAEVNRYKDFVIFVIIGGVASLVNLVARVAFNYLFSYEIAIILAFPVALSFAFILNRRLIFKAETGSWTGQFGRFLIVNLVALVQIFVISVLLARFVFPRIGMQFHPDLLAHAIGLVSPICTSYWAHKRYTFRPGTTVKSSPGLR